MASIIVGRSPYGQQKQRIENRSVSRRHLELTQLDGSQWKIRDLGSTYGTTVNGLPVVETVVGPNMPIMLGQFETSVRQLMELPLPQRTPGPTPIPTPNPKPQPQVEYVSVRHLERVYDEYQEALKALAIQKGRANIMRMLPLQLVMPLALGLSGIMIPDDTNGSIIKGAIMLAVMALTSLLSLRMLSVNTHQVEEQFELNQQFQIDYVCPKCKNFFGAVKPYRALLNQGQCPYCKSKFRESKS